MKIAISALSVAIALFFAVAIADDTAEYGVYTNPSPSVYDKCDTQDLIDLSQCCNHVLSKLDDCKADDLACECCALQSMKKGCFNLCPGNPSANFLTVLFEDCSALQDTNACALPFKKDDEILSKTSDHRTTFDKYTFKSKAKNDDITNRYAKDLVTVKSKIKNTDDGNTEIISSEVNLLIDFENITRQSQQITNNSIIRNATDIVYNVTDNHSYFNRSSSNERSTSDSNHAYSSSSKYTILTIGSSMLMYAIL